MAALSASVLAGSVARAADSEPNGPGAEAPAAAERIFSDAKPRLLQIRAIVSAVGQQSSLGSGFLVTADGLAVTNYHVVSQYAIDPESYRLEYISADGTHGDVKLLAIDLADDLAVVRIDHDNNTFFRFDERAINGSLPKGERLYSLGNPLDIGFTIVEGTYNGLVERSYNERIHFTGAINPGMSGGPTVTGDSRVVGINVAKLVGNDLVSFLVPARFAAALLERARNNDAYAPQALHAEIARQLAEWQGGFYRAIEEKGFRTAAFGPYYGGESATPWFTCWSQTNAGQVPKPRANVYSTACSSDTRLFVALDLSTGVVQLSHAHVRSVDLNAFQFAAFLSQHSLPAWSGAWSRKWHTKQRCDVDFLAASRPASGPPLRVVWCARAYREFAGLYDVSVTSVTQDRSSEALISRLTMQGVSFDNAMALSKSFLEAVQWNK